MLATTTTNLSLRRSSEPLQVKDAPPHAGAPTNAGSKEFELSAVCADQRGADKTITLLTRTDASVADLKGQLATKCGLAVVDLSLVWGSKPLWRDGFTLGEYGLRGGATLVATGRVRGGGGLLSKEKGCIAGMTTPVREWWARIEAGAPLVWHHFHGQGRLAVLVLGPAGDDSTAGADIRLLSARKLVRTSTAAARWRSARPSRRRHGRLPRRGDGARPPPRARGTGKISGVVALSYAWVTPRRPRPAARAAAGAPAGARVVDVRARAAEAGLRGRHDPDGRLRLQRLHRLHVDVPAGRHHRRQARVHEAGRAGVVRRALATSACSGHAGSVVFKMTRRRRPTAI